LKECKEYFWETEDDEESNYANVSDRIANTLNKNK
jgi:hypothetical protein